MRRSYRLSELIEELQRIQAAPVSPEAVKTGQAQVFVSVKDLSRGDRNNIAIMRGEIDIVDMGAYIDIGIFK